MGRADLLLQLSIYGLVAMWTNLLFEEGEQHRDDNTGLGCLTKDNEEDGHSKDVDHLEVRFPSQDYEAAEPSKRLVEERMQA